jgi:hypothetical protein
MRFALLSIGPVERVHVSLEIVERLKPSKPKRRCYMSCPTCGKSQAKVNEEGWLQTYYVCANSLCHNYGKLFSENTWLGTGADALSIGWRVMN